MLLLDLKSSGTTLLTCVIVAGVMWCKHYAAIISVTHENEELQWELFEDGHSQSKFKKKMRLKKTILLHLNVKSP